MVKGRRTSSFNTSRDHVGHEGQSVHNSYSLILCTQREVLLAWLREGSQWAVKKKNRDARVLSKRAPLPVRSCKHSSTKSSACSVSHIQCGTDNVTLRYRLHFTCQLCARHNSTVNAVDWPLLRRMTSGARSVTEAVRLLCARFRGHYGGWVFFQKSAVKFQLPSLTFQTSVCSLCIWSNCF